MASGSPFDLQNYMEQTLAAYPAGIENVQKRIGALQDYIQNQQSTQANIPALQFAAGLLRPTKTGGFSESLGNAGEGALESLSKQRQIDFERQGKIAELEQAKQNLLINSMQIAPQLMSSMADLTFMKSMGMPTTMGGAGGAPVAAGPGGPSAGPPGVQSLLENGPAPLDMGSPAAAPAPARAAAAASINGQQVPEPVKQQLDWAANIVALSHQNPMVTRSALYQKQLQTALELQKQYLGPGFAWDPQQGAIPLGANDPGQAGRVAGAVAGAQKAAESPYTFVDVFDPATNAPKKVSIAQLHALMPSGGTGGAAPAGGGGASGPAQAGGPPASPLGSLLDAAPQTGPSLGDPERVKAISEDEATQRSAYKSRPAVQQRLNALSGILETYQPGTFAEEKANLVGALRSGGIPMPDTATANPAAFQEFVKNATGQVFDQLKEYSGGVRVAEIEGLQRAFANPTLQPAAAKAILGQAIGMANWMNKRDEDYFDWRNKNPHSMYPETFYTGWQKDNNLNDFVRDASGGIAALGVPIPPKDKLKDGDMFIDPVAGDIMKWNAAKGAFDTIEK